MTKREMLRLSRYPGTDAERRAQQDEIRAQRLEVVEILYDVDEQLAVWRQFISGLEGWLAAHDQGLIPCDCCPATDAPRPHGPATARPEDA